MSLEPESTISPLQHVAIIMDGNNRWATEKRLKGIAGHQAGADRLQEIVEACRDHDIQVLTVFAFSSENWCRPKQEVKALMTLFAQSLRRYRSELKEQNVSLRVIGRRDRFSNKLQKLIEEVEQHTSGGDRTLVVAADYGGRWDMAQAMKRVADQVKEGAINPDQVDEDFAGQFLTLSDLPDVDLLIRTGAEKRISNFLLWQISYAELIFTECYWPDFDKEELANVIEEFYTRQRRFGDNPIGKKMAQEEVLSSKSRC